MILADNLKQLYYFYVVAKNRSFTSASKQLFISQPAISMQIKNIENSLGIKLIKKERHFALTKEGELLYNYLDFIFEKLCEAEQKLFEYSLKEVNKITIGMSEAYSHHFIINILGKFQEKFPHVGLKFFTETSKNLIYKLLNNQIDIAIYGETNIKLDKEKFIEKEIKKERIILVAPFGHELSDKSNITLNEIVKEKIILKDENSATRTFIEKVFRNKKIPVFLECESSQVLKKLLSEYNALTFLTKIGVQKELDNKEFVELNFYKELYMPIKIAYPKKLAEINSFNFIVKTISSIL